mmetsp:Transcript_100072/g.280396  ORF Transcript_100072/g.280396 Transcript_100072/m.280396 type:complete len:304 (+) Transcript_100072:3461-4372(+)
MVLGQMIPGSAATAARRRLHIDTVLSPLPPIQHSRSPCHAPQLTGQRPSPRPTTDHLTPASSRTPSKMSASSGGDRQREPESSVDRLPAVPPAAGDAASRRERAGSHFDVCMACARRHLVPVAEVKRSFDEFAAMDKNRDGVLTPEEFETVVRKLCHVGPGVPTPPHLFQWQWRIMDPMGRGFVDFEDFFAWSRNTAFCSDLASKNDVEVSMRKLASSFGIDVLHLERVRTVFSRFVDGGSSGHIDKHNFKHVLCRTMGLPQDADVPEETVRRYFREIDVNNNGEVDFEEFARWYLSVHSSEG